MVHLLVYIAITLFIHTCAAETRSISVNGQTYNCTLMPVDISDKSLCFVDVMVFNSSSYTFPLPNVHVIVLSDELKNGMNYSRGLTNKDGKVCLPVNCQKYARIIVEANNARIPAADLVYQRQFLPPSYLVEHEYFAEVIRFHATWWGTILGKSGPVYRNTEQNMCLQAGGNNNHFLFSYPSFSDVLDTTPNPMESDDPFTQLDAWRYGFFYYEMATCYIKVKVKTMHSGARLTATSMSPDGMVRYGVFTAGLQFDPSAQDTSQRVACLAFRCPVIDDKGRHNSTEVVGNISVPGHRNGCCFNDKGNRYFNVDSQIFETKQDFAPGDSYGPNVGVYIHQNPEIARAKCLTGLELKQGEYTVDVNLGVLFEYDCSDDCNPLSIVG